MNIMLATDDQKRRANEAVAATLGIFAISTPRDDPGARFGYECALLAIMQGDEALLLAERKDGALESLMIAFRHLGEAMTDIEAARH